MYFRENGHHVVELHDMRYASSTEGTDSMWGLTVRFSRDGEVLDIARSRHAMRGDRGELIARVWEDIWNP